MQLNKNQFALNKDLINSVSKISDELAGKLFKHILAYANDLNPITDNVLINLLFYPVEHAFIENKKREEHFKTLCSEAGTKSAELRKNTSEPQGTSRNLKEPQGRLKTKPKIIQNEKHLEIIQIFNEVCSTLPKASLTDDRAKLIDKILETYSLEQIGIVFTNTAKSDFLSGRKESWKANFNWLFNPKNFLKVLEGNYENIIPGTTPKDIKSQLEKASNAVNDFFKK